MYKIVNRKKLIATRLADAFGSVLFAPVRLFRRPRALRPEQVRRILVIRTAYLGDVVMTLPMLKPLRQRFPGAHVTFLTSDAARPVLKTNPYVDEVLTYSPFWFYPTPKREYFAFLRTLRSRSFDLVIEARGDLREILLLVTPLKADVRVSSGIGGGAYLLTHVVPYERTVHKVEYHLSMARFLGCPVGGEIEWGLYLTEAERAAAGELLAQHGIREPFVVVHPGSRLPLKRWPLERFVALCEWIQSDLDRPLVLVGSSEERDLVREISQGLRRPPVVLAGRLGIRELAAVLDRAALFIGNDSGPMHIAASMGTPALGIFGPSKSDETAPYGSMHRVVEKDVPCRGACDESTCRYVEHHACMRAIRVDDVQAAVREMVRVGRE